MLSSMIVKALSIFKRRTDTDAHFRLYQDASCALWVDAAVTGAYPIAVFNDVEEAINFLLGEPLT